FFSSRRRHTRFSRDWSSDVCSSDLCGVKARFIFSAFYGVIEDGPDVEFVQRGYRLAAVVERFAAAELFEKRLFYKIKYRQMERRSEERRVGKECRYHGCASQSKRTG